MLYVLASMLIMLTLIDRSLRIGRLETLRLETRFKLFALRDKLRHAAICGDVPYNRWFAYLDTSLTKSIDVLPQISVWEALALVYSYRNNKSLLKAQLELLAALAQEENRQLAEVYKEYLVCLTTLLVKRHRAAGYTAMALARVVGGVTNLKGRLAAIFTIAPETSTLLTRKS